MRALVFGASGSIGSALLPRLGAAGVEVEAVSRRPQPARAGLHWRQGALESPPPLDAHYDLIYSLGPLDAFAHWYARAGAPAARVIAFGSTSVLTKSDSPDPAERALVERLRRAEEQLFAAGAERGAAVTVLRPTLIWGYGDRSLSRIAALARRWRAFPLPRNATGLRQPVHADDLAAAAFAAAHAPAVAGQAYALPGGETLPYREMVARVLAAFTPPPRLLLLPAPLFRAGLGLARAAGLEVGAGVLARLDRDLVFDAAPAARDLGYTPRAFAPTAAAFDTRN